MIAIIDYNAGNLKSVERALRGLGAECRITRDREEIGNSERIIIPGVGAAGKAIEDLRRLGLDSALERAFAENKPIMGICLGAQVILDKSEENQARCLGLIKGEVKRLPSPLLSENGERLKIPHMGWNGVTLQRDHPVMKGITPSDEFYFVHAYYTLPASRDFVIGTTDHGLDFASVIGRGSLIAVQFHPEKSGPPGLRILENFCAWGGPVC